MKAIRKDKHKNNPSYKYLTATITSGVNFFLVEEKILRVFSSLTHQELTSFVICFVHS